MHTILVTGAAGFIGSHICRRLIAEGFYVIGIDDLSVGKIENIPNECDFIEGDLASVSTCSNLPPKVDFVMNLAGQSSGEKSFENPILDLKKNTQAVLNLIRYCEKNDVKKLIQASSMSVYGDNKSADFTPSEGSQCLPKSCYGTAKLAAENYLLVFSNKIPSLALRMFNVYGPGQDMTNLKQGMVSIYLAQAMQSGLIEVKGTTERYRDFIYIDDVVDIWFSAVSESLSVTGVVNVGSGKKTTVKELLDLICSKIENSRYFVSEKTAGDQFGIYSANQRFESCFGKRKFTSISRGLDIFIEHQRNKSIA